MDIIFPKEKTEISSLDDLSAHISDRETYFISTLENVLNKGYDDQGWQSIENTPDQKIAKDYSQKRDKKNIFTGSFWCFFASLALEEAVEKIVKENNLDFSVDIGDVNTGYDAENWRKHRPEPTEIKHSILKVTDNLSKETMYFDPTYAQIDHRYAGKIVIVSEKDFQKKYQNSYGKVSYSIAPRFKEPYYRDKIKKSVMGEHAQFQRLVDTISS